MTSTGSPRSLSLLLKIRQEFKGKTDAEHKEWIEANNITAEELGMLANAAKSERNQTGEEVPLFPLEMFATEIARTALFKPRRRGPRKALVWEPIAGRGDIKIKYFGAELDSQTDLALWLLVISIARGQVAGVRIPTTLNALLRALGRSISGQSKKNIKLALDRLASATLRVELKRDDKHYTLTTSLMNWGVDELTEKMFIRVDPDGYLLFKNLSFLNFDSHLQLRGGVTKLLHIYAISHRRGKKHSQTLKNLKEWFGYIGRDRNFRSAIQDSIEQLEKQGVISDGKIHTHTGQDIASWTLIKPKD